MVILPIRSFIKIRLLEFPFENQFAFSALFLIISTQFNAYAKFDHIAFYHVLTFFK